MIVLCEVETKWNSLFTVSDRKKSEWVVYTDHDVDLIV